MFLLQNKLYVSLPVHISGNTSAGVGLSKDEISMPALLIFLFAFFLASYLNYKCIWFITHKENMKNIYMKKSYK